MNLVRDFVAAMCLVCGSTLFGQITSSGGVGAATQKAVEIGSEEHPVRVSGGVMAGRILHKGNPIAPQIPEGAKVAGALVLSVVVDPSGKVKKATVVSGPELVRETTLNAVREWTYKPFLVNGNPVFVLTTVIVYLHFGGV